MAIVVIVPRHNIIVLNNYNMKKIIAVTLFCAVSGAGFAQRKFNDRSPAPVSGDGSYQKRYTNKFPSPESATFDNNGNDLRGFINSNKNALNANGAAVNDASGFSWGYAQVKMVRIPGEDKKGNLNYYEAFDATLVLTKGKDGNKATWWAREYNQPKGPLLYYKAGDPGILSIDNVRYTEVLSDLQQKSFTLIEYYDSIGSQKDFDILLKNTLMVAGGTIKEVGDYKLLVDFYNGFLAKFSNVNDPVLDDKSFITFFKGNNANYVAYFNVINGKLSGRLELIDAPFERDKIKLVADIFKKLTGSFIYIYGAAPFGMDKMIVKRAEATNMKVAQRSTTASRKFNEDF